MSEQIDADHLVVGAGATGMAFTDALVDHSDARVVIVDRRAGPGGHWREAYPFVRLHQSSAFYGVPSTLLGGGRLQDSGPEAGLQERASQTEIVEYYERALARLEATGRVRLITGSEYADGEVVSADGDRWTVAERTRVVDARYLAPTIPAEVPAPFAVDGARVVPVNDLARLEDTPSQYVVVGSGKTATDAIVWLLQRGTDPGAITWVRPREPWMFNRAVIQPDPAVFATMGADVWESAAHAESLDDLFLRMEAVGVMLRIDRSLTPTMARCPTIGAWEIDLLRTVEDVVRLGHVRLAERGRLVLDGGTVEIADDALVVHCAASGLQIPPLVPVWRPEAITLQPIRAGFPCFGAALVGYVEATRDDDAEKNRLCPPSHYGNTLADWVEMNLLGTRATAAFTSEPDVKAWADSVALYPSRVPEGYPPSPVLDAARERLAAYTARGMERAAELVAAARL
ncbi:hypothetical protein J2X46_000922 [Nocardioides sp. BE266]|uniref:NAD(P)-binding protein n=1 Tax=Nocardioides sp. BE266 TaxID=2817725 RepID=UPI0028619EA5|nr:NAD(P)-binding protein [Nocardioides sp. BE266]MDR7251946.1 hypothetical protein [Nocardioides sp. BE266]